MEKNLRRKLPWREYALIGFALINLSYGCTTSENIRHHWDTLKTNFERYQHLKYEWETPEEKETDNGGENDGNGGHEGGPSGGRGGNPGGR